MTIWIKRCLVLVLSGLMISGCTGCSANHRSGKSSAEISEKNQAQQTMEQSSSRSLSTHFQSQRKEPASLPTVLNADHEEQIRKPSEPVRGIYVSGWVAGSRKHMDRLIHLIDTTNLNAMVIDVKNDYGELTYRSNIPEVRTMGAASHPAIKDIHALISRLKSRNIYCIGRIVVFNDPLYVRKKPELAFQKKNGGVWLDHQGKAWIDPYQPEPRSYNIAIAEEAASLGFDEIQFDYVRFPDNGAKVDTEVRYAGINGSSKAEVIQLFLQQAKDRLHSAGVRISADVFGLVTSSRDDMGIGQSWPAIASVVDVISPMTYPSHYSQGMYGINSPDLQPYKVIRKAMADAMRRNKALNATPKKQAAQIRPWLQGFTATWVHPHQRYGAHQINKQIQAANEQGVKEFLLWSSNCKYDYRS
ncbi:putative glycoside hydrolase [Paenibacillus sepulcri]|uniref:Glycoside hydrolase n=1 Tax=Paenibacillus sepulcri TaxID=359917 RepID=A0ABS7C0B1_9BACL|nr:putative glycoside hydrolase [Paenibacillus sepulcri]